MTYYCELNLWGVISKAAIDQLYNSVISPFSYTPEDFFEAIENNAELAFNRVREQELSTMDTALLRSGLGFLLTANPDSGDAFESIIWDPLRNEKHRFQTINGKLHLPAEVIDCPEMLARAKRGRDLYFQAPDKPTGVFETAHEMIELLQAHPELTAYAKQMA